MSEKFSFDTTDLDDFEDVSLADAADYQDQTNPAPLAPGNFRFRVDEGGRKSNQDGEPIDDNGYPQVQVTKVSIVEPEEFVGRSVYPFQAFSLRPIQNGKRKGAVPAVDLLRSFDDTLTFANGKELLNLLREKIESGATFVASANWVAKDSEFIKSEIEAAGGDLSDLDEDARRELFKKAIIRGQKKFPKVNGFYVPELVGPSGDTIEARVTLTRLYPSSKEVKKMGPFTKEVK